VTPKPRSSLAQVFDNPIFERWQNRRGRRILSVLQAAASLLLATTVVVALGSEIPLWLSIAVIAVATLVWVVAQGYLNASIAGVTELKTDELDEVQRAFRDSAYRRAYPTGMVAVTVFLVLTLIALNDNPWLTLNLILGIDLLLWIAVISAPVHVLAWTLPEVDEGFPRPLD
jgi:hypothetical protein